MPERLDSSAGVGLTFANGHFKAANAICPVSKALAATLTTLTAHLV